MVITVKVKTLDSQTYDFTVDDEINVRRFKEIISEKTNISADSQRIIYCGRVLVDEKPLKEYDVNGKVVHVVERPPPSARPAVLVSETVPQRPRERVDVRGSPMFRALDGMVLSTMTIPVNRNEGAAQQTTQTLPSSTFCINRITVARHMLNCANNIAAYLENPERQGLNNSPMDILTQARWTMESTVVEVGISATGNVEIPQNQQQQFAEALRGAFSAALRQAPHPNVTVVQLPTMFGPNGSSSASAEQEAQQNATADDAANQSEETVNGVSSEGAAAEVNNSTSQEPNQTNANNSQSNSTSPTSQRPRTGTGTLAEVVQQMRNVQTRLEPFVEQFYQLLLDDPPFEENDTTGRENAQRLFDRVSEALHYMSHAQHAISDLMLDMSQSTPRHLCCRPILVEQSGFVSSNNYLTSFLAPNGNNNEAAARNNNTSTPTQNGEVQINGNETSGRATLATAMPRPVPPQQDQSTTSSPGEINTSQTPTTVQNLQQTNAPSSAAITIGPMGQQGQSQNPRNINARGLHSIFSPLFLPMTNRSTTTTTTHANAENSSSNQENEPTAEIVLHLAPRRLFVPNPQVHVARLIQAVVNSAPLDADLHVQINAPNLLTFGVPVTAIPSQPSTQSSSSTQTNGTTTTSESNNAEPSQLRSTTATHPTTSTQTRSTARPHVHVANLPSSQMWNARVIPASMLSSFDRFLPCNSHHIRESELPENNQPGPNLFARSRNPTRQRRQPPPESPAASTPRSATTTQAPSSARSSSSDDMFYLSRENLDTPINLFGSNLFLWNLIDIVHSPSTLNRIRNELHTYIVNNLFSGSPITEENMTEAVNQVIQLLNNALVSLPQFELPDYDSRASVENFIRNTLPSIINLIREDDSAEFGTRLLRELKSFVRRLFAILLTCVGRQNAELYLNQIAQTTITSNNAIEQEILRVLQRRIMTAVIRELDITRQNPGEVQEFLVIRRTEAEPVSRPAVPMEVDDTEASGPSTSPSQSTPPEEEEEEEAALQQLAFPTLPLPPPLPDDDEPLPSVVVNSEPWHSHFPSSWLPIITRDISRQRRQTPQSPFSDAYISTMSSKRRKLIQSTKPPTDVPSLLSDGVRRALQTVGVSNNSSNSPSVDEVSTAISTDPIAQSSYREALRSNISERLKSDTDFTAERFPQSSKYFDKGN